MPKFDRGRFSAKPKREAVLRDERIDELERKLGQVTMDDALLNKKRERMAGGVPLGRRRSRR